MSVWSSHQKKKWAGRVAPTQIVFEKLKIPLYSTQTHAACAQCLLTGANISLERERESREI